MLTAIGIALAMPAASPPTSSPPGVVVLAPHPRPPATRTVTTTYSCDDGPRSFSIVYERHAFSRWSAGERAGVPLTAESLERATGALRRLDAVATILAECAGDSDVLLVIGRLGNQRVILPLRWRADTLVPAEPFAIAD